MNVQSRGRKVNYRQMIIFGLMALAAIYHFGRPTLEKMTGWSLPAIVEEDQRSANKSGDDYNYDTSLPNSSGNSSANRSSGGGNSGVNPGKAARSWLTETGRNKYKSPAGLIYSGSNVDHVLLHLKDDTSKPTHGIYAHNAVEVMKMIDEAYEKGKTGASGAKKERQGDRTIYTAAMGRLVGHSGGRNAKGRNRKELRGIKLVLAGDRVITAYPVK